MDFINSVILTRASARNYTGEPVPEELLEKIARAGMAAPSAVNVQPWELVLVTKKEVLLRLCHELPYAKMLDQAGAALVVCGNPDKDTIFAQDYWVQDCSAMTQNILLAAHSLGLGAVWTAVYPEESRIHAVREILNIPAEIVPLNVIPLGVIAGEVPPPRDKFNPRFLHRDTW